ncbi:hypothetical protein BDR04DRAFT_1123492 [Suillus decipiens]|nr:hypothetical protein BDR04DRAFT_1123492 [Suillus decipiens]
MVNTLDAPSEPTQNISLLMMTLIDQMSMSWAISNVMMIHWNLPDHHFNTAALHSLSASKLVVASSGDAILDQGIISSHDDVVHFIYNDSSQEVHILVSNAPSSEVIFNAALQGDKDEARSEKINVIGRGAVGNDDKAEASLFYISRRAVDCSFPSSESPCLKTEILEHTLEEAFLQYFERVVWILNEGLTIVLLAKGIFGPIGGILGVQVLLEAGVVVRHVNSFTQQQYEFIGGGAINLEYSASKMPKACIQNCKHEKLGMMLEADSKVLSSNKLLLSEEELKQEGVGDRGSKRSIHDFTRMFINCRNVRLRLGSIVQ